MMIKKKIHNLLIKEFTRFPKSEAQDYYKLLFQAVYGAEHMIQNYNDCFEMLNKEMSQIKVDFNCPLYHDISLTFSLVRVNLSRCKADKIDYQTISKAFFEGAKIDLKTDIRGFGTYLKIAVNALLKHPFNINEKILDVFIRKVRKLDFPAVHHSESYKNSYKPHYRVIPFKIWKKYIS